MIIKFANGKTVEGFLLARNENAMRVALEGSPDAAEFVEVEGTWLAEDLQPVEITFEWQRVSLEKDVLTEAQCICPQDLAAHLVRLLTIDSEKESARPRYFTAGQSIN